MTPTARLHFTYIISILTAIIVVLLTVRLADDEPVVAYISFALTISSLLLAVLAIVYGFISNASIAQSMGDLHQAASSMRDSAASVMRLTRHMEEGFGSVTTKLAATHELVLSLSSNPPTPSPAPESQQAKDIEGMAQGLVSRSSDFGQLALYATATAFRRKKPFSGVKLSNVFKDEVFPYYFMGWVWACDAARLIDIHRDGTEMDAPWSMKSYSPKLLEELDVAVKAAPAGDALGWNTSTIAKIDAFFAGNGKE
jgi:ABC-type multidrug transport system fused ATPase/permease subunit